MASGKGKQYGLILPGKGSVAQAPTTIRKNVFGDDSDSDSDGGGDWVKNSLKLKAQTSVLKRTTKNQMKKALAEDPTVFQYDEIYDDLEQKKEEVTAAKKGVEKKPRYIQALLQTAEKRKQESERRIERQVQKEREEEGNQFADKESFVTSSYRQKLEEFKKQEEEEKRMERLEAIGDVTRQKDLTGFYRHLYRQTMGESLPGAADAPKVEKGESDEPCDGKETQEDLKEKNEESVTKKEDRKKDRHYRKRRSSSSSNENSDAEDQSAVVKKDKNIDADSDFTGSSSSSSESESSHTNGSEEGEIKKKNKGASKKTKKADKAPKKKPKTDENEKNKPVPDAALPVKEEPLSPKEKELPGEDNEDGKSSKEGELTVKEETGNDTSVKIDKEEKPKIDIWAKRTVGQAFDDAIQRYYERKAARVASRAGRA